MNSDERMQRATEIMLESMALKKESDKIHLRFEELKTLPNTEEKLEELDKINKRMEEITNRLRDLRDEIVKLKEMAITDAVKLSAIKNFKKEDGDDFNYIR